MFIHLASNRGFSVNLIFNEFQNQSASFKDEEIRHMMEVELSVLLEQDGNLTLKD